MYWIARWIGKKSTTLRHGCHGVAWPLLPSDAAFDGYWAFTRGGSYWQCSPGSIEVLGLQKNEPVRVNHLDQRYCIIHTPSARKEVLTRFGLERKLDKYPRLWVWAEGSELVEVWGSRSENPQPDDPLTCLYPLWDEQFS